jgi:glutathione S-transferase
LNKEIAMSEFTVHSVPGSPFGRAVLATLEEKGAAYRFAPVAPGTMRAPEHLARHPFGRVPVLEHNGFSLYESQAILRYLDRVLPTPGLTPGDPRAAARMDQAMNVNDWYLFQGVANVITFHRVVGPRLMGLAPDEAAIEAAMPKAHAVFTELARLLGEQPYFAGDAVSLADLLIAPQLAFFTQTPEWSVLSAPLANMVAWLARMEARPSFQATTWERVAEMAKAA